MKVLVIVCALLLVVFVSSVDAESDADLERVEYCTYVGLWKASGNKVGYPDYKGIYEETCNEP